MVSQAFMGVNWPDGTLQQPSDITINVRKSADWIQSGESIPSTTTLRLCINDSFFDIAVATNGTMTCAPLGVSTPTTQITVYRSSAGASSPMNFPPIGVGQYSPTYGNQNPPPNDDWEALAASFVKVPVTNVIYAYEITSPTVEYTNTPGWFPKWTIDGLDTNQPVGNLIPRPLDGELDKQQVSIFNQLIGVSQSSYGAKITGAISNGPFGLTPYLEQLEGTGNVVINIDINPASYIDGYDVPKFTPYTPPGGTNPNITIIIDTTPNPPRDGGSGGRPVVGTPGGGGTPTTPDHIAIEVAPDPIAHDNTDVGTIKTKSFTVKNIGTVAVEVNEVVNTHPDNIFLFAMNSPIGFPFSIDPDETFGGTAYFAPASAVVYNEIGYVKKGVNILRSFSITGTGTASGNPGDTPIRKIALTGDTSSKGDLNFLETTIGESVTKTIKAFNVGNLPLILSSVSLGGAGVFTSPGVPAGLSVAVGEFKEIDVTFTPVGAQEYLGTFTLNSNAQASDQPGFNPATGSITCNLSGLGTALTPITRIMSFNVQNNGTFSDVLAGGSASDEITATITNIGNATLLIGQFQVEQPFSLELDAFGNYSIGSFEFYSLEEPLLIEAGQTSQPFTIKFTPPTVTNFVDDVFVVSNKTIGPEAFEVRGAGVLTTEEPEEPDIPVTPDDEPPPGDEFDPGTVPSSALDGNGASCIPKECEVTYVYEYSSNGQIVT